MFRELLNFIRWLWQAVVLPYVVLALMTLFSEGVEAVGQLRHSLYVMLCFIRGRSHRRFPLREAQLRAAKLHTLQHLRHTTATSTAPRHDASLARTVDERGGGNTMEDMARQPSLPQTTTTTTTTTTAAARTTTDAGNEEKDTISSSNTDTAVSAEASTREAATSESSGNNVSSVVSAAQASLGQLAGQTAHEPPYIQRRLLLGRRGETERWLSAVAGVVLIPPAYPLSYSHSLHQLVFNVIGPIQQPTVSTLPTRHTVPQWPPHYTRSYLTAHPIHTRAIDAAAGAIGAGGRMGRLGSYPPFAAGQTSEMTTDEYSSTTTTTTTSARAARVGQLQQLQPQMMMLHARHCGLSSGRSSIIATTPSNVVTNVNTAAAAVVVGNTSAGQGVSGSSGHTSRGLSSPDPYHTAALRNECARREEMSNTENSARLLPPPIVVTAVREEEEAEVRGGGYGGGHAAPARNARTSGLGSETSDASAGVVYRRVSSRQLDFMRRGKARHTTSGGDKGGAGMRTVSSPIASITAHHVLSYQATRQKVLVMDLDETLCYVSTSTANMLHAPTFSEVIPTASGAELYHVWVRPHAQLFLATMAKLFNLVLFTSSSKPYADTILARIDPEYKLRRRYYRQDCRLVPRGTLARLTLGTTHGPVNRSTGMHGRTTRPVIHSSAANALGQPPAVHAEGGTRRDNPLSAAEGGGKDTEREEERGGEGHDEPAAGQRQPPEQEEEEDDAEVTAAMPEKPRLNENAKVFVKDLRILKVPPELIVMIDNCEECLLLNRENALIVAPYFPSAAAPRYAAKMIADEAGNGSEEDIQEEDDVLLALMPFLESMLVVPDVRSILRYGKAY